MARAIITNDDGISSPGLYALARAAASAGLEVVIAAPSTQSSGSSAGIMASGDAITASGEEGRIHMESRTLDAVPDVTAFAVDAAPALITLLAVHGSFGGAPDLVLSGINRGANVGRAILHSGTVGAALTAGVNGVRGMAVSLDVGLDPTHFHWNTAARIVERLIPVAFAQPETAVLNVNVPNVDGDPELREARLSEFGIVQTTATERVAADIRLTVVHPGESAHEQSDTALLMAGFATVTSITSIAETPLVGSLPLSATE